MKLSEAISLGAMLGPQISGDYIHQESHGSCAIGAAMLAVGRDDVTLDNYMDARILFPSLGLEMRFKLEPDEELDDRIIALNDEAGLTREQIADWIVARGYDCEMVQSATAEVVELVEVSA